jgi:flagellar biosynthesis/type III secretory pathway protein FliH
MTNNKQQSSVEWLIEKCACADLKPELWEIIKQQAREMHKKEMSYADGYAEGYKRALEMIEWYIKNHISGMPQDHIVDSNKKV